jgi:hypothetical protein
MVQADTDGVEVDPSGVVHLKGRCNATGELRRIYSLTTKVDVLVFELERPLRSKMSLGLQKLDTMT